MKVVILGSGAMGCLYGAYLHKAGQDVTLIDVSLPHIDAINKNGLRLTTDAGDEYLPIPACLAADYKDTADLILLFTKSAFSRAALESISHGIGPDTYLMTLQNGLGHDRLIGEFAARDRIIIGTTNFPSDLTGFGSIAVHGTGVTKMQCLAEQKPAFMDEVEAVFKKAELNPTVTEEVFKAIWEKVSFNCAMNALTSITLLPQGYLGQTKEGHELAHTIADEVLSVAKAKGIPVDADSVHATIDGLFTNHFMHCPSMLQDVLNRRITEIAFLNGAVSKEAQELGMSVPVTDTVYKLVSVIQQTYEYRKEIQ